MGGIHKLPVMLHKDPMGREQDTARNGANMGERDITTALLLLVALRRAHPRSLSTYQLGLAVVDDKDPPRPLSVLIKSLAKDRYIEKAADAGKRTGYWRISDHGLISLRRRAEAAAAAERWLETNPNYTEAERAVLESLSRHGPQAASRLSTTSGMLHSPVRTALKRLCLREVVRAPKPPATEYALTKLGAAEAAALASAEHR